MKKSAKILLALLGGVLLIFGIKELLSVPGKVDAVKATVELKGAGLDRANEGKIVIVNGVVQVLKGAQDTKFGFAFDSPVVRREEYNYSKIESKDENMTSSSDRWGWTRTNSQVLIGEARIGDFRIDAELLKQFPTTHGVTELAEEPLSWYFSENADGRVWFSESEFRNIYFRDAFAYENTKKYSYLSFEPGTYVTIVARQQGDLLVRAEENLEADVHEGRLSKRDIFKDSEKTANGTAIFMMVMGAACLFVAIKSPLKTKD